MKKDAKPKNKRKYSYPYTFNRYPEWLNYDRWNDEITSLKSTDFAVLKRLMELGWKFKKNSFHTNHKELSGYLHLKTRRSIRVSLKKLKEKELINYKKGTWEGNESEITINWNKINELYGKAKDKILVCNGGTKRKRGQRECVLKIPSPHSKKQKKQQEGIFKTPSHTGKEKKEGVDAVERVSKRYHSKKYIKKYIKKSTATGLEENPKSQLYVKPIPELTDYFKGILQVDRLRRKDHRILANICKTRIPFVVVQSAVMGALEKTKEKKIFTVEYFKSAIYDAHRTQTHTIAPEEELMTLEQKEKSRKFKDIIKGIANEKAV